MEILYFAYGSNLRRAQMDRLCPGHHFIGPAQLAGHRLAFTLPDDEWEGGVADVQPAKGETVWGALYRVSRDGLAALDEYELHDPSGPREHDAYVRRKVEVQTMDGRMWPGVECYFVSRPAGHVPPSARYRATLLDGARESGFPEAYVKAMHRIFTGDR